MQHEITSRHALLDSAGGLVEPGYTKGLLMDYDRRAIKGGALRIKEWDYYLIHAGSFAVALTIADNSYMGLDSISLLDFTGVPWEHTNSPMSFMTMGRRNFPSGSDSGSVESGNGKYSIRFAHNGDHRLLTFRMDDFKDGNPIKGEIRLENPEQESMVICTPYKEKKTAFYYNQKINCMPASGWVEYAGKTYTLREGEAWGTLDWGRGVWTYKNTWYWGSASWTVDGVPFGWNIGYGFGDTSAASENMLFYNGKAHKLSQVRFNIPMKNGKEDYMSPWTFTSDDGRFEMDFKPYLDRASKTDVVVICSDQHQVFGLFTGEARLDDGTIIQVNDLPGFAEKVMNKW